MWAALAANFNQPIISLLQIPMVHDDIQRAEFDSPFQGVSRYIHAFEYSHIEKQNRKGALKFNFISEYSLSTTAILTNISCWFGFAPTEGSACFFSFYDKVRIISTYTSHCTKIRSKPVQVL